MNVLTLFITTFLREDLQIKFVFMILQGFKYHKIVKNAFKFQKLIFQKVLQIQQNCLVIILSSTLLTGCKNFMSTSHCIAWNFWHKVIKENCYFVKNIDNKPYLYLSFGAIEQYFWLILLSTSSLTLQESKNAFTMTFNYSECKHCLLKLS